MLRNLLFLLCFLAVSCAPEYHPLVEKIQPADALKSGFREQIVNTTLFPLYTLLKKGKEDSLHVYIEGDGNAYVRKDQISNNPTPRYPIGLALALKDPTKGSILYLSRPGQYISLQQNPVHFRYWTFARMHPNVVRAFNYAIGRAKQLTGAKTITLCGFSGGGGLAALVAASRKDVTKLCTIAGLLDHRLWSKEHGVSELKESLNPVDFAQNLQSLPQEHYLGGEDTVISEAVLQSFLAKIHREKTLRVIPGKGHITDWQTIYPYNE